MKIRVRFTKSGPMKFIGHLDVMHFFQQLLRRSGIPIAYSTGMSPHQIMSFALPLGIGLESVGEYMDIEINEAVPSLQAVECMNRHSVEGIEILSFKALPEGALNAMASVTAADYEVGFREGFLPSFDLSAAMTGLFERDSVTVLKKTKKSEKETDIKPLVYSFEAFKDRLLLKLSCGSVDNIKPELVMKALYGYHGTELCDYALRIKRLDMYTGERDELNSLDSIGSDIDDQGDYNRV